MAHGISIIVILADTVTQSTGDVTGYEGGSVTLSCNYTTSITGGHYLFWYIQRPHDSPKYMLKKFSFGGEEHAPGDRNTLNPLQKLLEKKYNIKSKENTAT
uniref:Immunoglobulin V-set domain-containing protein n=1 Tax=Scleropages formosus TaxID=113540 RepID=A0A8D0CJ42_SCLFO